MAKKISNDVKIEKLLNSLNFIKYLIIYVCYKLDKKARCFRTYGPSFYHYFGLHMSYFNLLTFYWLCNFFTVNTFLDCVFTRNILPEYRFKENFCNII